MFRLLEVGEAVAAGDEFFDTYHGWSTVTHAGFGASLTPSALPVRRKIEDAVEFGTTPNRQSDANCACELMGTDGSAIFKCSCGRSFVMCDPRRK